MCRVCVQGLGRQKMIKSRCKLFLLVCTGFGSAPIVDQATQGRASARMRRVCVQGLGRKKMIKSRCKLFLFNCASLSLQKKYKRCPCKYVSTDWFSAPMACVGLFREMGCWHHKCDWERQSFRAKSV